MIIVLSFIANYINIIMNNGLSSLSIYRSQNGSRTLYPLSYLTFTITLGYRYYYYPCFAERETQDCFADTVKIHSSGTKYNVCFYAVMHQTVLTCLDYVRGIPAA